MTPGVGALVLYHDRSAAVEDDRLASGECQCERAEDPGGAGADDERMAQ